MHLPAPENASLALQPNVREPHMANEADTKNIEDVLAEVGEAAGKGNSVSVGDHWMPSDNGRWGRS
jgi:hypothetical protein